MPDPVQEITIRQILVALDASPHSEAALKAAVALAAQVGAELLGLFVEDVDLLRLADLPITREIRLFEAQPGRLTRRDLRHQLRIQALRARRALISAAEPYRVRYRFRVTQGRVYKELLAAAAEADLLMLGRAGSLYSSRRKLGTTTRAVLAGAQGPVMVISPRLLPDRPVLVVYDGSAPARSALQLAAQLAPDDPKNALKILILADTAEEVHRLQHEIIEQYGDQIPGLHFRPLTRFPMSRLTEVVLQERGGLLVVPAWSPMLQGRPWEQFLSKVDNPVLFVR